MENGRFDGYPANNIADEEYLEWLEKRIRNYCEGEGNSYFKSKQLVKDTHDGRLGYALSVLEDRGLIEKWSSNNTPTTWKYNG